MSNRHRSFAFLPLLWTTLFVCLGGWTLASSTPPPAKIRYVTKAIEDVRVGDLVIARREHGQEVARKPVVAVYRRTSDHLRVLTFCDAAGHRQILKTTDEHPFWVERKGAFFKAGDLEVGHRFIGPSGESQRLVATFRENLAGEIPVFNFQVGGFHTYYVSEETGLPPILVHNATKWYLVNGIERRYGGVPKGSFSWKNWLKGMIGDAPDDMYNPHAHHILFKKGNGAAQQALVEEGQHILRKVGIDPIWGKENLVWAPNGVKGQHGIDALENVVKHLRKLDEAGGNYDDFVDLLRELGETAARRQ